MLSCVLSVLSELLSTTLPVLLSLVRSDCVACCSVLSCVLSVLSELLSTALPVLLSLVRSDCERRTVAC